MNNIKQLFQVHLILGCSLFSLARWWCLLVHSLSSFCFLLLFPWVKQCQRTVNTSINNSALRLLLCMNLGHRYSKEVALMEEPDVKSNLQSVNHSEWHNDPFFKQTCLAQNPRVCVCMCVEMNIKYSCFAVQTWLALMRHSPTVSTAPALPFVRRFSACNPSATLARGCGQTPEELPGDFTKSTGLVAACSGRANAALICPRHQSPHRVTHLSNAHVAEWRLTADLSELTWVRLWVTLSAPFNLQLGRPVQHALVLHDSLCSYL